MGTHANNVGGPDALNTSVVLIHHRQVNSNSCSAIQHESSSLVPVLVCNQENQGTDETLTGHVDRAGDGDVTECKNLEFYSMSLITNHQSLTSMIPT